MIPTPNQQLPELFTKEIFGHPTDFLIEKTLDEKNERYLVKVSTVIPALCRQGNFVASFAPPRYPWPKQKEPKK